MGIVLFLSVVTALSALTTFGFWRWRRQLTEFRSLRLGRLTLFVWGSAFVTANFLILTLSAFDSDHFGSILWLIFVEILIFIFGSLFLGVAIPVAIVVLTLQMWRRESKSFANFLLPITVLFFLIVDFIYAWTVGKIGTLPPHYTWLTILAAIFPVIAIYLAWQMTVFFVASLAYGRRTRHETARIFVVHGAGLVGGSKVGKLLQNRIKAAVNHSNDDTIFVMSGGKGDDERLSEAQAMRDYAIEDLGIPDKRILMEDKSATTYENLVNSSQMIHEKFLFFSSDFHVFRAALFAASLKLDAQGGPGGKTALYYRVPAFMREFVAVMNSERKKHFFWISLIVGIFVVLALLSVLF
ncbi:MAG: YdcF family protein [Streptococcaceae bacterium]|jgi:uncharacterized SAM-binding protein YcdF (DUF218 family)|nr:YdcF family protein [Streptococcaceae bacterium]